MRGIRLPREDHHAVAGHAAQLGQALGAIGPVVHGEPASAASKARVRNGSAVAEAWITGAAPAGRWRIISRESSTATTGRSAGS